MEGVAENTWITGGLQLYQDKFLIGSATAPLPLLSHDKDTTPENRRVDQCGSVWMSVDEKGSNGISVDQCG